MGVEERAVARGGYGSDRWSEWRRKAREAEGGRDDDDIVGDSHGGWSLQSRPAGHVPHWSAVIDPCNRPPRLL